MIHDADRGRFHRGSHGFTLVELLVVIGIIALLMSILIPTLSRARASAVSVNCMSNLRQIGQAAYIYASQWKGYYPPAKPDAIEVITGGGNNFHRNKENFFNLLKGNTQVFYCPANFIFDFEGDDGAHQPKWFKEPNITQNAAQVNADVRIRYWYMADPWLPTGEPATGYANFVDFNNNGTTRDEYVKKPGQKGASLLAIACDQSRQATNNFNNEQMFLHPGGGGGIVNRLRGGSKNVLLGDGHVENRRKDECKVRWGPNNNAMW